MRSVESGFSQGRYPFELHNTLILSYWLLTLTSLRKCLWRSTKPFLKPIDIFMWGRAYVILGEPFYLSFCRKRWEWFVSLQTLSKANTAVYYPPPRKCFTDSVPWASLIAPLCSSQRCFIVWGGPRPLLPSKPWFGIFLFVNSCPFSHPKFSCHLELFCVLSEVSCCSLLRHQPSSHYSPPCIQSPSTPPRTSFPCKLGQSFNSPWPSVPKQNLRLSLGIEQRVDSSPTYSFWKQVSSDENRSTCDFRREVPIQRIGSKRVSTVWCEYDCSRWSVVWPYGFVFDAWIRRWWGVCRAPKSTISTHHSSCRSWENVKFIPCDLSLQSSRKRGEILQWIVGS